MSWYFQRQTRAAISSAGLKSAPEGELRIDCVFRFGGRSDAVAPIPNMSWDKESGEDEMKKNLHRSLQVS